MESNVAEWGQLVFVLTALFGFLKFFFGGVGKGAKELSTQLIEALRNDTKVKKELSESLTNMALAQQEMTLVFKANMDVLGKQVQHLGDRDKYLFERIEESDTTVKLTIKHTQGQIQEDLKEMKGIIINAYK